MRVPVIVAALVALMGLGVWLWVSAPVPSSVPAASDATTEAARSESPAASSAAPAPRERRPAAPAATAAPAPEPERVAPAPTTVTLRVESDVPGATVFLDRVSVGTTPMTLNDVSPGSHRLNVFAQGYESYLETLDLEPGPHTVSVAFKEIRIDAQVQVVHKHGIGSCRGTLRASPEGVRFDATDGNDSFVVSYANLETFDIDYLGKALRVKVRGGRSYSFTPGAESADPLFVFHEEVDKVRTRLRTSS